MKYYSNKFLMLHLQNMGNKDCTDECNIESIFVSAVCRYRDHKYNLSI